MNRFVGPFTFRPHITPRGHFFVAALARLGINGVQLCERKLVNWVLGVDQECNRMGLARSAKAAAGDPHREGRVAEFLLKGSDLVGQHLARNRTELGPALSERRSGRARGLGFHVNGDIGIHLAEIGNP